MTLLDTVEGGMVHDVLRPVARLLPCSTTWAPTIVTALVIGLSSSPVMRVRMRLVRRMMRKTGTMFSDLSAFVCLFE